MHLSISDIEWDMERQYQSLNTAKLVISVLKKDGFGIWMSKDTGARIIYIFIDTHPIVEVICGVDFVTVKKQGSHPTYVEYGWIQSITERNFERVDDPSFNWSVFIDWIKKACYTVQAQSEL